MSLQQARGWHRQLPNSPKLPGSPAALPMKLTTFVLKSVGFPNDKQRLKYRRIPTKITKSHTLLMGIQRGRWNHSNSTGFTGIYKCQTHYLNI